MALSRWKYLRVFLLCLLVVAALLTLFAGVSQSGGKGAKGKPTFRSTGVAPEAGEMDPRLEAALNAFGAGRYEECRKLAETLLGRGFQPSQLRLLRRSRLPLPSNADDTIAECVGLIILSHLHRGDFAAARAAVDRLRIISPGVCQDLLAQVSREERDYNTRINRLQAIVATTITDPDKAAKAQLLTARTHQMWGRTDLAEQSYRKVVERYPVTPPAARAVTQIATVAVARGDIEGAKTIYREAMNSTRANLSQADAMNRLATLESRQENVEEAEQLWWTVITEHPTAQEGGDALRALVASQRNRGEAEHARRTCEQVLMSAPDTALGVVACELMLACLEDQKPPASEEAKQQLSWVLSLFPNTAAGRWVKPRLAAMHLKDGLQQEKKRSYLPAAEELKAALALAALSARDTLTALRAIGECYMQTRQETAAIPYLEHALESATEPQQQADLAYILGTCHYMLLDYQEGYHLFRLAASLSLNNDFKEMAQAVADECVMQAAEAGRPFQPENEISKVKGARITCLTKDYCSSLQPESR